MASPPICNYEGSRYSSEFWTRERSYEDAAERVALRALLPSAGKTLIEIGAGFGRVADLYAGYETVVLFDYARTQLEQAMARLGHGGETGGPRYVFVQGDFYHLPFVPGLFDCVTMIRTLHHAADAPRVLRNISQVLGPNGAFVLEFANKHNLKAILRYGLKRQVWSPYRLDPVEFVDLNYNFHPRWMWAQLRELGLRREAIRTVSHFRIGLLKRLIPTRMLVWLDAWLQPTGRWWQLSPSVFVRARADASKAAAAGGTFFCCPVCAAPLEGLPQASAESLHCGCGRVWHREDGIYDFRPQGLYGGSPT